MSLVKILVLSNVLDPSVSLQELIDAFWVVDEIENDETIRAETRASALSR